MPAFSTGQRTDVPKSGAGYATPEPIAARDINVGAGTMFGHIADAFNALGRFVRPAAEKAAADRGTSQALADIRENRFRYRQPYTVRGRAYNEAAERVIGAQVRTAFSQGIGDTITAAGSAEDLRAGLAGLVDSSMGDLGPEFGNLRVGLEAQAAALYEMSRGRFADAAPMAARDRAAARSARAAVEATPAALAAAGGEVSPERVPDMVRESVTALAEWGPPEAFSIGELAFEPNPGRPGILQPSEIAATSESVTSSLTRMAAEGIASQAAVLTHLIEAAQNRLSGLPASMREAVIAAAETEKARRNAERRSSEAAAERTAGRFAGRPIPPGVEFPPDMPPPLVADVTAGRRAAGVLAEMEGIPFDAQLVELDRRAGTLAPAPDADLVGTSVLVLDRLAEAAASGALADDPEAIMEALTIPPGDFERGRVQWGGKVRALTERLIEEGIPSSPDALADIEAAARHLAGLGRTHAIAARTQDAVEATALERAGAEIAARGRRGAVPLARSMGWDVPEIGGPDIGAMAESVVARSAAMASARDRTGIVVGSDLTPSEAAALAESLTAASVPERTAFFEAIGELDVTERRYLSNAFRETAPVLAAAITAAAFAPQQAARALDEGAVAARNAPLTAETAGEAVAAVAADLATVGVPDAPRVALSSLAPDLGRAIDEKIPPEDLAAELSPAQARWVRDNADRPPEASEAEKAAIRIAVDGNVRRLADAVRYVPDSQEAVAAFSRMIEGYEALPEEERDAFIEAQALKRRQAEVARLARPLFYSGDQITTDGLREAGRRIVEAYRGGRLSEEDYRTQALLIQRLAGEVTDG